MEFLAIALLLLVIPPCPAVQNDLLDLIFRRRNWYYIAIKRDRHNQPLLQRFQPDAPPPDDEASALEWMRWRLQTKEGREIYSRRKCTIEPTFGIQKEAMGYRRFLVRGLEAVSREWELVCLAYNLRRMFSLKQENDELWQLLVLYCLVLRLNLMAMAVKPVRISVQ